jgi:rhodanese-related sulfurtransferase
MSHTPTTPQQPGPWRKAIREARGVVIASFLIAVTYNIFAVTSVPWLREARPHDTAAVATLGDTTAPGTDTAAQPQVETPATPGPDTIATPTPDTTITGLSAAQRDSLMKAQRDSTRLARQEATRVRDSMENVEILAILASGKDINTDIAKKIYDRKLATFIDARPEDQYMAGHIKNAINIYAEQWQTGIPELVKIPRDTPIVTYCGGGDECELSHDLAKNLRTFGFKSVAVYMGGITDWTAKKYPTGAAQP